MSGTLPNGSRQNSSTGSFNDTPNLIHDPHPRRFSTGDSLDNRPKKKNKIGHPDSTKDNKGVLFRRSSTGDVSVNSSSSFLTVESILPRKKNPQSAEITQVVPPKILANPPPKIIQQAVEPHKSIPTPTLEPQATKPTSVTELPRPKPIPLIEPPRPKTDIYGRSPSKEPKYPISCPTCGRIISVSRFAAHLEKCLGISGRSSVSGGGGLNSKR